MILSKLGHAIGSLLRHIPAWVFSAAAIALLLWLTLSPDPLPENDIPLFEGADKVVHALMFGGVYFALAFDWAEHRRRRTRGKESAVTASMAMTAFLITVALGGGIELLQGAMQMGRGAEWADFVADCAGAALSVWITPSLLRWLR